MITKLASRLISLTAVRIGVVIGARWDEFDGIDQAWPGAPAPDAIWRIPAARMKLTVEDKSNNAFGDDVLLSSQAVAVLRTIRVVSGFRDLLFPNDKSRREPMSEVAVSSLYKRMRGGAYRNRMVPHDWRAAFSTIRNERAADLNRDGDRLIIGMILANFPAVISASEWAYNRARYRRPRTDLLRAWADKICDDAEYPQSLIGMEARAGLC
ncbi:hypothetical protein EAH79_05820 [Sphingomonas koreensis]|nr:hypothetical protein EAH79_05820 [Sphingomonas koreensis]